MDVLNASTGRNNSTEVKMKPFILSGSFASGFSMALMAKDLQTAADLAEELGMNAGIVKDTAELWSEASARAGQRGRPYRNLSPYRRLVRHEE